MIVTPLPFFVVNGLKFREKRPRAKGVTRKKTEKGTSTRNRDYLTSQREQPKVSREIERRGKYPKKTRGLDLLHAHYMKEIVTSGSPILTEYQTRRNLTQPFSGEI